MKEYEKESGYKLGLDSNGELGYEGFPMDISTPVTLEVTDDVVVSISNGMEVNDTDFNNILQRNYKIRSVFEITLENGIVTKIIDPRVF